MAVEQAQQELVGLVNDLAQLNFQQSLALKELEQRGQAEARQFLQRFEEYRKDAEQRILDLEQSYSLSLMNVIKNRALLAQGESREDMITEEEHKLQISSQRLEFERQLRQFDEERREEEQNLCSERDNLKLTVEEQEIQIKAYKCELEVLKSEEMMLNKSKATQSLLPMNQSNDDFELKYSICTGTNTVDRSEAELEDFEHNNVDFVVKNENGSNIQLSAQIIPWLLASETTERILSTRHAKLLETLHERDEIITHLSSQLCKIQNGTEGDEERIKKLETDYRVVIMEKENSELLYRSEIEDLEEQLRVEEINLSALEAEKRTESVKHYQMSNELELYEAQIRNSRDMYFTEFQQLEHMQENSRIGYLENQVIYLSNFEKIYARTLSDVSRRNASLSESNEELRMYNIQFNARLNELEAEAQRKVEEEYERLIFSYEQSENSYLRENGYLKGALEEKCTEIQQIEAFEGTLKQTVEDLRTENAQLCVLQREELTQYENLHARYRTLRRQFADSILSKEDAKGLYNGVVDSVGHDHDRIIEEQTECSILLNALAVRLSEVARNSGKHSDDYIHEVIAGSTSIQFDRGLSWLWEISFEPSYSKLSKQNMELTEVERSILEERDAGLCGIMLECNFTQTDPPQDFLSEINKIDRIEMLDACEEVAFHTDESQLLEEAYREINSLNQQLSDYNELMKRFGSIKEKIFEECYYDDIEMVRECKETTALAEEDLNAEIERYVRLVDHWSTHKCPTLETFRPVIDGLLQNLREVKDAEISTLSKQTEFEAVELKAEEEENQNLQENYLELRNRVLAMSFDYGSVTAAFSNVFSRVQSIIAQFNRVELQLELTTKATTGTVLLLREEIRERDEAFIKESEEEAAARYRASSSFSNAQSSTHGHQTQTKALEGHARRKGRNDPLPEVPRRLAPEETVLTTKDAYFDNPDKTQDASAREPEKHGIESIKSISSAHISQTDSLSFDRCTINSTGKSQYNYPYGLRKNNSFAITSGRLGNSKEEFGPVLRRSASGGLVVKLDAVNDLPSDYEEEYGDCENISPISSKEEIVVELKDFCAEVETLREDLFHSLYLEQFTMMKQEITSFILNTQGLREKIAAKDTSIATWEEQVISLQNELKNKEREIEYNFVHRPSREEDIAMMKRQEQEIQEFKEWYLMSLSDNERLIDQINKSEREIEGFFGRSQYNTDPSSSQNDIANFTKEELIHLRKEGQTKIDKLFAAEDYGGLASMKIGDKQEAKKSIIPQEYLDQQKINMEEAEIIRKIPYSSSYESINLATNKETGSNPQAISMTEQKSQSSTVNESSIDAAPQLTVVSDEFMVGNAETTVQSTTTQQHSATQPLSDRLVFEGHQEYPAKEFQYLFNTTELPPRVPPIEEEAGTEEVHGSETASRHGSSNREVEGELRSKSLIGTLKEQSAMEDSRLPKGVGNQKLWSNISREIREERSSSNLADHVPENMLRNWREASVEETERKSERVLEATRAELSPDSIVRSQELDYVEDLKRRAREKENSEAVSNSDYAEDIIKSVDIPPLSKSNVGTEFEITDETRHNTVLPKDEAWEVGRIGSGVRMSRELRERRGGLVKFAKHLPGEKK